MGRRLGRCEHRHGKRDVWVCEVGLLSEEGLRIRIHVLHVGNVIQICQQLIIKKKKLKKKSHPKAPPLPL